jgi:hypothetical protein
VSDGLSWQNASAIVLMASGLPQLATQFGRNGRHVHVPSPVETAAKTSPNRAAIARLSYQTDQLFDRSAVIKLGYFFLLLHLFPKEGVV